MRDHGIVIVLIYFNNFPNKLTNTHLKIIYKSMFGRNHYNFVINLQLK